MPNKTPVILIVGHGSLGAKKDVIDIHSYNIVLLSKPGHIFCLSAHNMVVQSLLNGAKLGVDSLQKAVDNLELLPSTTTVSKHNAQDIHSISRNLSTSVERRKQQDEIKQAEKQATDSRHAWELFEHKISPAPEILETPEAFLPSRVLPERYKKYPLFVNDFMKHNTLTLSISLDYQKLHQQISDISTRKSASTLYSEQKDDEPPAKAHSKEALAHTLPIKEYKVLDGSSIKMKCLELPQDHAVYITPIVQNSTKDTGQITSCTLSSILESFSKIHIFVKCVMQGTQSQVITLEYVMHEEVLSQPWEIQPDGTTWYDVTLPSDASVVLGICRYEDGAF